MKNDSCIITIYSDNFKQVWYKDGNKWIQETNGIKREATNEQLLSHILPLMLDGYEGKFKVKVEKR